MVFITHHHIHAFPIIMPKKKKAATICRNCLAQCGPARAWT